MQASGNARFRAVSSAAASIAAHLAVVGLLLATSHWSPRIAPIRLPGTVAGTDLLPVYSLGGAPGMFAPAHPLPARRTPASRAVPRRPAPSPAALPQPLPTPAAPPVPGPELSNAAHSAGSGSSGDSALGEDNINIALVRNHPSPAPDLSVLPHGSAGDVVLDIVIDAQGNIAGIKLARGLNPSIDDSVIATVRQWNFAPATRNGQAVPSEQEILFHYMRS